MACRSVQINIRGGIRIGLASYAIVAAISGSADAQDISIPYDGIKGTPPSGGLECTDSAETVLEQDRCDVLAMLSEKALNWQRCLLSENAPNCENVSDEMRAAREAIAELTGPPATAGTVSEAWTREDTGTFFFSDAENDSENRPRSQATRFDE